MNLKIIIKLTSILLIVVSTRSHALPFSISFGYAAPNQQGFEDAIFGAFDQFLPLQNAHPTRLQFDWSTDFNDGTSTIADARSNHTKVLYSVVREKLILKNPELSLLLPQGPSLPVYRDGTIEYYSYIDVTNANFNALGIPCCTLHWGGLKEDAIIRVNAKKADDFTFTTSKTKIDLQQVLGHEIGHALGFESNVDSNEPLPPTVLDLFRFSDLSIQKGEISGLGPIPDFSFDDREKYAFDWSNSTIASCFTDQPSKATLPSCRKIMFETGVRVMNPNGDAAQASHWLDNVNFILETKPFPEICDPQPNEVNCWDSFKQKWVQAGDLYLPLVTARNSLDPTIGLTDTAGILGGDLWMFDLMGYELEDFGVLSSLGGLGTGYLGGGAPNCLEAYDNICTRYENGPLSSPSPPDTSPTGIPEPSIITLFIAGLVGVGFARRRQA